MEGKDEEEKLRLQARIRELVQHDKVANDLIELARTSKDEVRSLGYTVKNLELSAKIREEKKLRGEPTDWGILGGLFGVLFSIGFILVGSWIMLSIPRWIGHPGNPMPHFVAAWAPFALGRIGLSGSRNNPQSNVELYWWVMGFTSIGVWLYLHFFT